MSVLLPLYVVGLAIGLVRGNGSLPTRIGLASLWPLGFLAFGVTVSILLLTSLVAFPVWGAVIVAAAVAAFFAL